MAKIDLIVGVKNAMKAGLAKANNSVKKFSKSLRKAASGATKAFKRAGLAVAAFGGAMILTAKNAQEFNKQIGQVSTLADINIGKAKKQVMDLSAEFGLAKEELTKGLYDALSAGVPKDNAFEFLRTSAKAAVAGAGTTAEAVDLLTTSINAFKLPAEDAEKVANTLFTTVRLGKTTLSELSASMATVAPIANASGVKLEEVAAAMATLTKQGTPTAQAATQLRAALFSANEVLDDGWSKTMTLQDAFAKLSNKVNGSQKELKNLVGRKEAVMAVLQLTGNSAKMAAEDLSEMSRSTGAANDAFRKMITQNPLDKMFQSIDNLRKIIGDKFLVVFAEEIKAVGAWAKKAGESFAAWAQDGGMDKIRENVNKIIGAIKAVVALKFEIALAAMTAAAVTGAVKLANLVKKIIAMTTAMKAAMVASNGMVVAQNAIAGSAAVATAATVKLRIALIGLKTAGIVGLFVAAAAAVFKFVKSIKQTISETKNLKKTMRDLKAQEKEFQEQWGVRLSVAEEIRKAIQSGNKEQIEYYRNRFPDAIKKFEEALSDTKEEAIEVQDATEGINIQIDKTTEKTKKLKNAIDEKHQSSMQDYRDMLAAEKALEDKRDSLIKQIKQKQIQAIEEERDKALKANKKKIDAINEEINKKKELVQKGVQGILAEAKAEQERQKQAERDAKKAARLRGAGAIAPAEQRWLDAFDKIEKAKKEAAQGGALQGQLAAAKAAGANIQAQAQKKIADLKPTEKKLDDLKTELKTTNKLLGDNLKAR